MFDLRKLFARDGRHENDDGQDTQVDAAVPPGSGLEAEYQDLIASQCRRWGIAAEAVTIEVRQVGRAPDGLDVYLGMVRLAQWERNSALRLLLGLPLLETKIRRMVRTLWIGELSHFGGLWLHASEQLHATSAMRELRDLMIQLTPPATRAGEDAGMDDAGGTTLGMPLAPITTSPSLTGGASLHSRTDSLSGPGN